MLDIITMKLCDADGEAASRLVSECAEVLRKLRNLFVWVAGLITIMEVEHFHHASGIHHPTSTQPNFRNFTKIKCKTYRRSAS